MQYITRFLKRKRSIVSLLRLSGKLKPGFLVSLAIVTASTTLVALNVLLAWNPPTAAPPVGNVVTNWAANGPDIFNANVNEVGIGMVSPVTKLDVNGQERIWRNSPGTIQFHASLVINELDNPEIWMEDVANSTGGIGILGSTGLVIGAEGNISLKTNNTFLGGMSSGTTRLFVETTSGEVGIGNTAPTAMLHVTGGARVTGLASCDTIDTDVSGNLICGADAGAGASLWTDAGLHIYPTPAGSTASKFFDNGTVDLGVNTFDTASANSVVEIGNAVVNYTGNAGWPGTFATNILLSALDATTISFHDSGETVGTLGHDGNFFWLDGSQFWGPISLGINTRSPAATLHVFDGVFRVGQTAQAGLDYARTTGDLYLGGDASQSGNLFLKNNLGSIRVRINSDAASIFPADVAIQDALGNSGPRTFGSFQFGSNFGNFASISGLATGPFDDVTGLAFYTANAGAQTEKMRITNAGAIVPPVDNSGSIGTASLRWNLIQGVTITSGDLVFENSYRFTELPDDGLILYSNDERELSRWSDKSGEPIVTVPSVHVSKELLLTSPNGSCFAVSVEDSGTIRSVAVSCP